MNTGGGPRESKPHGWRKLVRIISRGPAEDAEAELAFHLEMRIKDYMAQGMTEAEAKAAAQVRLGDMDHIRVEVERVANQSAKTERRRVRYTDFRQDLRYGARVLRRTPTFTAMAVLTLALGIGATTAIFSLVYSVLLAPLPYPQPDELVRVWETSPQGDPRNPVSSGNAVDWQERVASFTTLGAYGGVAPLTLTGEGEPARVNVARITPAVFEVLRVDPVVGRVLADEDTESGSTVVLAHETWIERYSGSQDVLGRQVILNDRSYTVVGVMPPGFSFPDDGVDLWVPLGNRNFDPAERTSHNYNVIARLAPGTGIQGAQSELDAVVAGITEQNPAEMTGWGARIVPLHEDITAGVAPLLTVLLGGVLVVLLIACANLANLLLARAVARRREMAVRGALGASRGRVLGQLLTESGLLALLGGIGALFVAPLLIRVLVSSAPAGTPLLDGATMDLRMLAFAGATALGCALLFGLAPSLRLSRTSFDSALRTARDASPSGQIGLRSALLVVQVGLTVVLLVGAGLFVRSFRALNDTDLGFDPSNLALMLVDLPSARYPDNPAHVAMYTQLLQRIEALPGVVSAAATSQAPGATGAMTFSFAIDGRVATNPNGREDDEPLHAVTPGYFEVLGRRIV
ncbi:MAG: ABC transporter permease, partial [Gemmatimonadota bacterium]|nr:ABC transporter permease [Gemmatimonadota bacterium]